MARDLVARARTKPTWELTEIIMRKKERKKRKKKEEEEKERESCRRARANVTVTNDDESTEDEEDDDGDFAGVPRSVALSSGMHNDLSGQTGIHSSYFQWERRGLSRLCLDTAPKELT